MIFGEYSYEDDIRVQRQEAFEDGVAQQKAEDEKLLAEERTLNAQKDEEIKRLLAENARLRAK